MQTGTPWNKPTFDQNTIQNGTTTVYTTNRVGRFTTSGDGTTNVFTFHHGLAAVPESVRVTAGSSNAASYPFFATADATNITVTYVGTAPVAETNNLTWRWAADL